MTNVRRQVTLVQFYARFARVLMFSVGIMRCFINLYVKKHRRYATVNAANEFKVTLMISDLQGRLRAMVASSPLNHMVKFPTFRLNIFPLLRSKSGSKTDA